MLLNFDQIDQTIGKFMRNWGNFALRWSFATIFIWFGILKPLGQSAAAGLVMDTVSWMPFLAPATWLAIIGWWEVIIGVCFIFKATTRIGIGLLFTQMVGTFLPLVILPEITFQEGRFLMPTMEGQYIIKNLMIISAALVIGGTTYRKYDEELN